MTAQKTPWFIFWIMAHLLLFACTPENEPAPPVTDTPTPGVTLTPYISPTPGAGPAATPTRVLSPTPLPSPTATPFLYEIVEGDTLIGIAFRFGVETQALIAANPEVDPQFLVIGQSIVIPLDPETALAGAQPTPAAEAVPVGQPVCYPAPDGSAWCFWLVENRGEGFLENLIANIRIYDAAGEILDSREALTPLNLLGPGERLPLMVWFPAGGGEIAGAAGELLAALPVPEGSPRYLETTLEFEVAGDENVAELRGSVEVLGDAPAAAVWIAVVLYGENGEVVGVRRFELEWAGRAIPFDWDVFSQGGAIAAVEVFAEARP